VLSSKENSFSFGRFAEKTQHCAMRNGVYAGRGGSCALGVDRRRSMVNTGAQGGWVWPGSRGERVRGGCTGVVGKSHGEARRSDARGRAR